MMNRRGFLRATAGGATVIAAASLLPAGCARDYPQATSDSYSLQSLTDKEYATARAAAEALLVGVPVTAWSVAQAIDRELALVGEPIRSDMKTVLNLIQHATILGGRVSRFTALSPDHRRRYLETWAHSRFELRRAAYQALKGFVVYFAYSQDATRALTGFHGSWPEQHVAIAPHAVDFGEIA
ncbi:MAG TPA: hypothetical protein VF035_05330 [Longimicrobiales bacterium]